MGILEQMQTEAIDKVVSHLEYATHNLKLIKEKLLAGQELNKIEQKFLEGHMLNL